MTKNDEEKLDKLYQEISNILIREIYNDDDNLLILENAMQSFCSPYDKCEGYKHAIMETLDDQYSNHYGENGLEEFESLLKLLSEKSSAVIMQNIVVNEAFVIDRAVVNEFDEDTVIVRCSGEDNLREMVEHIKNYKGVTH